MNFGLLLSTFPRVEESRPHYDAMLALDARPRPLARLLKRLASLIR
ncbi:hypothetical protein [Burkholderia multivorans]|nr:hypothetical protein [Burkholderia multivorans]